jgi:transposase
MTEREQELTEINEQLKHQIQLLEEKVEFLMKKLFGTSSEKNSKIGAGQLSIFDDNTPFFPNQRQLRNKPTKRKRK